MGARGVAARAAAPAAALGALLCPLARFAACALLVTTGSRLLLAALYAGRVGSPDALAGVMARGWRFDLVTVAAVCAVALVVQWLAPTAVLRSAAWRAVLAAWLGGWLVLITWNEAATPDFLAEFGVRPNHLYVEYLDAPREVLPTLWQAHRPALLAGLALATLAAALARRLLHARHAPAPPLRLRLVALAPLVALAFVGARGSTGHRPLNIGFAASTPDPLVNDLALNSTYSALHALVEMGRERDGLQAYGALPREEVIRRVRADMGLPASAFTDPARPSLHRLVPTGRAGARPNLVILLQESLGAHYVASLGGAPVAREIDGWRGRSLWFDQLYASGTRSARGVEAVVTGFPPTRVSSVLGLERAQHGFFTLAAALRAEGYRTEFIYGGDSSFDNMRGFLLGNGFERVVDWTELAPEARFTTTWGVSDEDLYARVHREVTTHEREGQPFFTFVFSTSNHPPYEFPAGRVEPVERPLATPANAARYADFAVGRYLATAERSAYWHDTLFLVVADHESRVVGNGLVPVMTFHVPGFVAGGPVEPRIVGRIASQTDLVPTVLSLMGIAALVPATGVDLSRPDLAGPGRALMQFHENAAYRVGDDVVVLAPHQPARHYTVAGQGLAPAPPDRELEREALALTQWPVMAYAGGLYR